ncbi:DeoR/GlpR family DNA-binding transcription regulator [Enterococcus sp. AZ103]|uniref:DeoR/GlpR family DNA-binding transcription regulator n=1 Tax=Enterococcus sp. AZ103 TaxID=2774628 RepID=UPI003F23D6E0
MYQEQRLVEIQKLLQEKEQLSTKEVMSIFDISRDTARRDISLLADRGLVQRTHGGIISNKEEQEIASYNQRLEKFSKEKSQIAKKALEFIEDGQTNFFDVSTIVLKMAQLIDQPCRIYSHSLDNSIMLSSNEKIDFYLIGGKFYRKNRFYYALNEAEILKNITFDVAFIGAAGLEDGKVTFQDESDAILKKLILKQTKTKILVAESKKFQQSATYFAADISEFDYLVTDHSVTNPFSSQIKIIV